MESSRFYYYFVKVGGVALVAFCGYVAFAAILFPDELGSSVPLEPTHRVFIAVGYLSLGATIGFGSWRMAIVRFHDSHLEVVRNGNRTEVPWWQVADIFKIPCTTPPMYWIRLIDRPGVIVMPWSWWVVSIGFWSWDFTHFQDAIRRHRSSAIRELNQK